MWCLLTGTWIIGGLSVADIVGSGGPLGYKKATLVANTDSPLEVTQSQKSSSPHLRIWSSSSCPAVWEALIFQAVPSALLNLERPELTGILSTSQSKMFFDMHMLSHFCVDPLWLILG